MTGRTVTAPDGRVWAVRRRWVPHRDGVGWRARFAQRRERVEARRAGRSDESRWYDHLDAPDFGDSIAAAVAIIAVLVLIVLTVLFGWTILLLGIDLLWLLLVGAAGLVGRVVLGRPWRVEAATDGERRDWFVQGFRSAGRARDEIARRVQHGLDPTQTPLV